MLLSIPQPNPRQAEFLRGANPYVSFGAGIADRAGCNMRNVSIISYGKPMG